MADYTANATLTYREDINPELTIIRVRPDQPVPPFTPGQYAELAVPPASPEELDKVERRSYSIASRSHPDEDLEFYIVRVHEGYFTSQLWHLNLGARLWCGPKIKGKFTLNDVPAGKDLLMVATGTGLAPFVSMLREHCENPPWRRVVLIHGARLQQDLGYKKDFEDFQTRYPWFAYLPTLTREPEGSSWTGARGRVQSLFERGLVAEKLGKPITKEDVHVLLCGNPQMIDDLELMLAVYQMKHHKKKDPGNIHVERYW